MWYRIKSQNKDNKWTTIALINSETATTPINFIRDNFTANTKKMALSYTSPDVKTKITDYYIRNHENRIVICRKTTDLLPTKH